MTQEELKMEIEELAVRFSEGWHEGIKIDASDIMLLNEVAQALAQPERHELQAKGEHPAPCARHCEANAFQIVIKNLKAQLAQPEQEPVMWSDYESNGMHHKPVAWMDADGNVSDNNDHKCFPIPLYATPPQRTEQEPVAMRMPKIGDKVICIEDDSLGEVAYLTAGGSPEIKFDDDSHGTYLLREFAELFRYATPPQRTEQEPVAHCKVRPLRGDESFPKVEIDWVNQPVLGPLYTSPPQRKPLSAEQVSKICAEWTDENGNTSSFGRRQIARAIEAAHGIKGDA